MPTLSTPGSLELSYSWEVFDLNQSKILPTKGEIKEAPASAHATAWVREKIKVQLHEIPSASNFLTACIPYQVPAILIKIQFLGTPDCS